MDRSWQEVADLKKFKVAAAPYGGPIGKKERLTHTVPVHYAYWDMK